MAANPLEFLRRMSAGKSAGKMIVSRDIVDHQIMPHLDYTSHILPPVVAIALPADYCAAVWMFGATR
ncbi:transmembrane protein, putative [Medicago truncatula]|uniref:Transmembrane protein, putative n=1 Tax=Medicago truncatula TaxID=3880 RepID=A0A072U726_MEDTR|nr:transmembrane protein, putative [Medicago truncatula]